MIVFGISAKKGCGKSTISEMLIDKIGNKKCQRIAIADFIRKECAKIFNLPYNVFVDQNVKELYFETSLGLCSPRKILQFWGEFRRKEKSKIYWLEKVEEYAKSISNIINKNRPSPKIFIIDDIRLKFEADYFKQKFNDYMNVFYMIRIEPYGGYSKVDDHITEIDMDDYQNYDAVFTPGFGLDELEKVANAIKSRFLI